MAIYTRTGDDGTTSLYGGARLSKADPRIEACGLVDELTSTLGVLRYHIQKKGKKEFVELIQQDLYMIMGFLAQAPVDISFCADRVREFEKKIDTLTTQLPHLTQFVIPQGSPASCWAHMARVSCRRAERGLVRAYKIKDIHAVLTYLNRLSDLLFMFARVWNEEKEIVLNKK